ncbi:MAG: hypothetical protein ACFCVE_12075 [Phycisphaerae bacterium]
MIAIRRRVGWTLLGPVLRLVPILAVCLWAVPLAAAGPLDDDIAKLVEEYREGLKADPPALARTTPNYFTDLPVGVTNDTLLGLLARRLDRNESADAYVKLQLLGALTDPLSPDDLKALRRLASTPAAYPKHPSVGNHAQMQQLIRGRGIDPLAAINAQWKQRVEAAAAQAEPIAYYRDALLARLPDEPATFFLAIQDAITRSNVAGWRANRRLNEVQIRMHAWAATAEPSEIGSLSQQLLRIRHLPTVVVYTRANLVRGSNTGALKWETACGHDISHRQIEYLVKILNSPNSIASGAASSTTLAQPVSLIP